MSSRAQRGIYGLFVVLIASSTAGAQQQITLKQAVDLSLKQGYQAKAAVATRDAGRGKDRAFGGTLRPQISLSATAPQFAKTITPAPQPDGSTLFTPLQETRSSAAMTIAQAIPFTGGNFSVTSSLQRYEISAATESSRSWTSSPVTFNLQQPIMRPNTIRWDLRQSDIELEASERRFLEAREQIAGETSNAFFDFYIAKRQLENASKNAATNDTLYTINKGRLEVGKIGENDLLQSELALLRARSAADNAKLEFERAEAAFRLAINLPPGAAIEVAPPASIPQFDADTAMAVAQALRNRAQISEMELQAVQARRGVSEARLNNGLGATVNASVGFNQTAPEMGLAYQDLLQAQRFTVGVNVPLIQWGVRSGKVQEAKAIQSRVDATNRAGREQVAQDARFAALQLTQARRNLEINAKADTVAQKRFDVAYNRYVIGRIAIDNLFIAQNEKDQAVTQYLQALRNYWGAYYRLRQITLYDFEAGQPIR